MENSNLQLILDPSVGVHECSGVTLPEMIGLLLRIRFILSSGSEVCCVTAQLKWGAPLAVLTAAGRALVPCFHFLWRGLVLGAFGLPCLGLSSGTGGVLGGV